MNEWWQRKDNVDKAFFYARMTIICFGIAVSAWLVVLLARIADLVFE